MFLTKLKLGAGAVLCAGLLLAVIGGSTTSRLFAQDAKAKSATPNQASASPKTELDADFIRRISQDLRGSDPTLAEVHFFVRTKDGDKRQKLIDLFIQERQAKKAAVLNAENANVVTALPSTYQNPIILQEATNWTFPLLQNSWTLAQNPYALTPAHDPNSVILSALLASENLVIKPMAELGTLQKDFYKEVQGAKEKGDVSRITQAYLDRLIDFVNADAKSQEVPDAMRQIVFVYESQGKTTEAGSWRDRLRKVRPKAADGSDPKNMPK